MALKCLIFSVLVAVAVAEHATSHQTIHFGSSTQHLVNTHYSSPSYHAPAHYSAPSHYQQPQLLHSVPAHYQQPQVLHSAPVHYSQPQALHSSPAHYSQPQFLHSAPLAHAAPVHYAAPSHYAAPALIKSAPALVKVHEAPAHYSFEYAVNDPHTGDVKEQKETRNGDQVQGYYALNEADGTRRVVHYTADDHHGFNAQVSHQGKAVAVKAAPVLLKAALPSAHQGYHY